MIYIIYKKPEDREKYEDYFNKINHFLYGGNDKVINKFYSKVKYINYSSFNNKDLLKEIDDEDYYILDKNDNSYYKSYYKIIPKMDELGTLVNIYTSIIAGDNENTTLESYGDDDTYFSGVYGSFDRLISEAILNNYNKIDIKEDFINFALLAFSNRVDTTKDNDLINGYLFDRKATKEKYEKIMGEDSFNRLEYYSRTIILNVLYNSFPRNEFIFMLNDLKRYFYLKMSKKDDISLNERNAMIINFNNLYSKLRDDCLNNKKKTL